MVEYEWIKMGLFDRRLSVVSEKTGLSIPTIRNVREGNGNPTIGTLNKLAAYLKGDGE